MDTPSIILATLKKQYSHIGLLQVGPVWCTLLAVMFSARTKDEQVLKLLPGFFSAFPTLEGLAKASIQDIEEKLSTIGMYKQKAKHAKALAAKLIDQYNGEVPRTIDELVTLPGIGRKSASVVVSSCFGGQAIAVDTHVARITRRLGWTKEESAEQIESALKELLPQKTWSEVNTVCVPFGRTVCTPRHPLCFACPVQASCRYTRKHLSPHAEDEQRLQERLQAEQDRQALHAHIKKILQTYVD